MNYYESTLIKEDLKRCASGNRCVHKSIGPVLLLDAFSNGNEYCDQCLQSRSRRRSIQRIGRRNRIAQLPNSFTSDDWQTALDHFDNRCAYCRRRDLLEKNYFIPLDDPNCPGTVKENILPSCRGCALSRIHNRPILERPEVLEYIQLMKNG